MDPVLLASFFFLIATAYSWSLCKTRDDARARAALQALLTIITPSCSLWPSRYTRLVKQASISPDNRIVLPLHSFVQDVLDGAIELRDPLNNLVDLTRATGIDANGWNVCLRVGSRSWVSTLKFRLAHKIIADGRVVSPSVRRVWMVNIEIFLRSIPSPPLPLYGLTIAKRSYQPRLSTPLKYYRDEAWNPTHARVHIDFSYSFRISFGPPRLPRNLPHILGLLTDKSLGDLTVHSVTNLSTLYHQELLKICRRISEDADFRKMLVNTFGVERWRRQKFHLALEAALVHQGLIEKWAVEVSKQ